MFSFIAARVRRKRTPYHKNQRYELEIEKEEAKLVERKRKRTVSYENPADITSDESPVVATITTPAATTSLATTLSEVPVKRGRGRPRKSAGERRIRIKFKGVGRGNYPRVKKIRRSASDELTDDVFTSESTPTTLPRTHSSKDPATTPGDNDRIQGPLQVVIDPDNHTKMRFMSVPRNANSSSLLLKDKPGGKRKRKTKHLGNVTSDNENVDDLYTFKDESDHDGFSVAAAPKRKYTYRIRKQVNIKVCLL